MKKTTKFMRDVIRGRQFEKCERSGWSHESGRMTIEAKTEWKEKRGRIDIKIDEKDGSVSIIELKATDWDHIGRSRIRVTALRHARQVWRYIYDTVLIKNKNVCPGIIYEKEPLDTSIRKKVERALNDRGIQVVWRRETEEGAS